MEYLDNLIFVLTHSAYLIPTAIIFAVLGFLLGCCKWAKYARELRLAKADGAEIEQLLGGTTPPVSKLSEPTKDTDAPKLEKPPSREKKSRVKKEKRSKEKEKAPESPQPAAPSETPAAEQELVTEKADANPANAKAPKATAGALAGVGALVASKFQGEEDQVKINNKLGVVYKRKPDQIDDLTELDGIDNKIAARINKAGIYKFKQLEVLSDQQRANFQSKFRIPNLNWDGWQSKLGLGAVAIGGAGLVAKATEAVSDKVGDLVDTPDPENTHNLSSPTPPLANQEIDVDIDKSSIDLAKPVGLSATLAGLGALGDKFKGEEDNLIIDDELGLVYKQKPDFVDDLTELDGIDSTTSAKLNDVGIYTHKQIEALDDSQRYSLESKFGLPKIDWDNWGSKMGWGTVATGAGLVGVGEMMDKASNTVDNIKDKLAGDDIEEQTMPITPPQKKAQKKATKKHPREN